MLSLTRRRRHDEPPGHDRASTPRGAGAARHGAAQDHLAHRRDGDGIASRACCTSTICGARSCSERRKTRRGCERQRHEHRDPQDTHDARRQGSARQAVAARRGRCAHRRQGVDARRRQRVEALRHQGRRGARLGAARRAACWPDLRPPVGGDGTARGRTADSPPRAEPRAEGARLPADPPQGKTGRRRNRLHGRRPARPAGADTRGTGRRACRRRCRRADARAFCGARARAATAPCASSWSCCCGRRVSGSRSSRSGRTERRHDGRLRPAPRRAGRAARSAWRSARRGSATSCGTAAGSTGARPDSRRTTSSA